MNTKIATGIFAFAAMFAMQAGNATAAEFVENGKYSFSQGDISYTFEVARQGGKGALGDGIYTLRYAGTYLYVDSDKVGSSVKNGKKPSNWVLHKSSNGWAMMLADNEANTISTVKENGSSHMELQRNQGYKNQVWQIKKR